MTIHVVRTTLLAVLEGDEELYEQLCSEGVIPRDEARLAPEHLELARVTYTLVRELEVNWPGVEVVLRLRAELIESRRQVAELLALLGEKSERGGREGPGA